MSTIVEPPFDERPATPAYRAHGPGLGTDSAVVADPESGRFGARRWWPTLDGIRGIAVAAVAAYHLEYSWARGGYLGVSLFFTLSGFLILGQLTVERDRSGSIDLRRFWERRVRRLAPASLLTIGVTLLVVAVRAPDAARRVGGDGLAALLYVANWRDLLSSDVYGERFGQLEPLGHLWSLSIEEQVYLLAPLLVMVAGVRLAGWTAAVVALTGVVLWWGSPDSYFATPYRLVEVLAGGLLGVWVYRGKPVPGALARLAPVGLAAVLISFATVELSSGAMSRFGLPLFSVASVVVLSGAIGAGGVGFVGGVLGSAPLRWLGDRSYAIYLFHIPLIELTDLSSGWIVGIVLVAADLSYRFVEQPIRLGAIRLSPAVGALALVALTGLVASNVSASSTASVSDRVQESLEAVESRSSPAPGSVDAEGGTATVPDDAVGAGSRVMTVGDSTMLAIEPALESYLETQDAELVAHAISKCSPVFTADVAWSYRFTPEPDATIGPIFCRKDVGELIAEAGRIDAVLLFDHGTPLLEHRHEGDPTWYSIRDPLFQEALERRYVQWIGEAESAGAAVVLATAPPAVTGSLAASYFGDDQEQRAAEYNAMVRRLAAADEHVSVVEIGPAVVAEPKRFSRDDDGVHLSANDGAVAAVIELIRPVLTDVL